MPSSNLARGHCSSTMSNANWAAGLKAWIPITTMTLLLLEATRQSHVVCAFMLHKFGPRDFPKGFVCP